MSQEYTKLTNIILPLYMIAKVDLKEFTFMRHQLKKGKREWPPTKPKELAYKAPNDVKFITLGLNISNKLQIGYMKKVNDLRKGS